MLVYLLFYFVYLFFAGCVVYLWVFFDCGLVFNCCFVIVLIAISFFVISS